MEMIRKTPVKLLLPSDGEDVKRFLTFVDKSVGFQLSKLKQNMRWKAGDPDGFNARIEELKAQQKKTLVFYDNDMNAWTYSGLWKELHERFGWEISHPDYSQFEGSIPWNKKPHEMRYYQKEAVDALVTAGHGAIELSTGSGKSLIILNLLKKYPVKTIIMTPSSNVTNQLYNNLVDAFGAKYVGKYGDGSKHYKKLFTVATGQALTRIKPNTPEWEELSTCKMFLTDESHTIPSETFERVAVGLAETAPLRFSISATQTRSDGSEMKLNGIIGPIVYRKDFKDLANEGFLKKPIVKIFKVPTYGSSKNDPKEETRAQLYNNPNVLKLAAEIVDKCVNVANRQVVVMIEEYSQFLLLKNYLKVPFEFVHGSTSKEVKEKLPEQYHKVDSEKIFKEFNEGKVKCLIGTSSVGVGVDLGPVGCLIYLQGGLSEVKVKQSIGRGTRPVAHKDLWVIDFKIMGSAVMERHLNQRMYIYEEISDSITMYP